MGRKGIKPMSEEAAALAKAAGGVAVGLLSAVLLLYFRGQWR